MSDFGSLAAVPLGLLKWLQFNVQKQSWVWREGGGKGVICIFNDKLIKDPGVTEKKRHGVAKLCCCDFNTSNLCTCTVIFFFF